MKDFINNVVVQISDHGNAILSKWTVYLGVSGSGIGVADGVAKAVSDNGGSGSDIGMLCGVGGFIVLFVKNLIVDVYFARKKDKREQELHDKGLDK